MIGKKLWEIGPFKETIASKAAFAQLRQKKFIRYEDIPLETKRGERVEVEFVSNLYQVDGKKVIQCNVRDISERMRVKDSLRNANEELSVLVVELQRHDHEMTLIKQMNDLLQACKSQEEAYQVIAMAVGEMFTGLDGGLAILHESGQYLETFSTWGKGPFMKLVFSMDDCWAMRRGEPHMVTEPKNNIICNHFEYIPDKGYLCLPLVVQGETMGLLCCTTPSGIKPEQVNSWKKLVQTIGEGIKLSISNLKLREIMREQATHDPLTGLFNRRYLKETLSRELNLARRHHLKTSISVIDIDHFKDFNDTYGHEAGDRILIELGRLFSNSIRKTDIACRYGGEEFVIVLFDSPQEESRHHLEKICTKVKEMQVLYGEYLLGKVSLSVGMVEASEAEKSTEEYLNEADKALYAAKRTGRDRIVIYSDLPNG
jgi:diguanylate cyclase (GGDEF)-like protein